MDRYNSTTKMFEVEKEQKWREWLDKIPFVKFPRGWEIKIIPPFGGATARFLVRVDDTCSVSIYLDCNNNLGYYSNEPYWEVYPVDDCVGRCDMADVPQLLRLIRKSMKELKNG